MRLFLCTCFGRICHSALSKAVIAAQKIFGYCRNGYTVFIPWWHGAMMEFVTFLGFLIYATGLLISKPSAERKEIEKLSTLIVLFKLI